MAPPLVSAYRGVTTLAPWLLAALARRAHARQGAPAHRLKERLGHATLARPAGRLIWLHAASVGEVQSLVGLATLLADDATLLVTTATQTGADRAASALPPGTLHQFQPIDTRGPVQQFLSHWRPDLAVMVEADMPPNMLAALNRRGIPAALIGARPSKTRQRFPKTARALLSRFDLITASAASVAQEMTALGLRVALVEDLKSAALTAHVTRPAWSHALAARKTWLAASTHPEDEAIVFAAQDALLARYPDTLLLIAPRHPRPDRGWLPARFRAAWHSDGLPLGLDTNVYVMDAFGQMPGLHAATSVCLIGGTFGTRGGHSPWEAATAGNHLLVGPDIENNKPAFDRLPHHIVRTPAELSAAVERAWTLPANSPPETTTAPEETATALRALMNRSKRPSG